MKKLTLIFCMFLTSFPAFSEKDDGAYEQIMYKTKYENGEITLFKVMCYSLNKHFCSLEELTLTNDEKKHGSCGIYSAVKFSREEASRKDNGSWVVSRKADRACDKHEEYTFTKSGMVKVTTSSSKPFNEEQKSVCKKFAPKILKAEIVDGWSVKNINIGKCKKMDVWMFSGGEPF